MCQIGDQFTEDIEKMSDKEIVGRATELLRDIFGKEVPDAVGSSHSAWGSEPFSMGSYSCSGVPPPCDSTTIPVYRVYLPLSRRNLWYILRV